MYDVIIVGGSYAGLSAALQIARARRRVLIVDAGRRRNRFAHETHGFLGRDGHSPNTIASQGRAEVLAYPTAEWRETAVIETRSIPGGFSVRTETEEHRTKRLILATGVVDELPAVPGLADRWGKTVFHCPYCHGYELGRGRLGVLAVGALSMHSAPLVSEWAEPGQTTFFLDEAFEPDATQIHDLHTRNITIERKKVSSIEGTAPEIIVRLVDDSVIPLQGLFVAPRTFVRGPFAEQLGCELEEGPMGYFYKTSVTKETTVSGVFACGDAALPAGAVALAVADGVRAGTAAHQSLVFRP